MNQIIHWSTMPEGKEKYYAYLCSREWSEKRNAVIKRCDGFCERCKRNKATQVHHLTYIRKYNELLTDLMGACDACHQFIHGHSDVDPKAEIEERERQIQEDREKQKAFRERMSQSDCPWERFRYGGMTFDNEMEELEALQTLINFERWQQGINLPANGRPANTRFDHLWKTKYGVKD